MKKRFRRLLRLENTFVLLLSLLLSCMISCNDEKVSVGEKYGFVTLNVQTDPAYNTKAGYTNPENVNEYLISIYREAELVDSFLYGEAAEGVELEAGNYKVSATWGEDFAANLGENFLYVEDSQNFLVREKMSTTVELTPTPANAKVVVDYSKDLDEYYPGGYSILFGTEYTGKDSLEHIKGEDRPAFFKVGSNGTMLELGMIFRTNEETYKYEDHLNLNPRDFLTLNVVMREGGDEETDDAYIKVDPSSIVFPAVSEGAVTITVDTNCETYTVTTSANADWITLDQREQAAGKLKINVDKNEGDLRTANLMLSGTVDNTSALEIVTIVQQSANSSGGGAELIIVSTPTAVTAEEFNNMAFTVWTNGESWTYTCTAEWLTIERDPQESILYASAPANTGDDERVATIMLTTSLNGKTETNEIKITQEVQSPKPTITVTDNGVEINQSVFFTDGKEAVKILSVETTENAEWSFTESTVSWLTLERQGDNLVISVEENEKTTARSTLVVLTAKTEKNKTATKTLIINQPGSIPSLSLVITINDSTFIKDLPPYEIEAPAENTDIEMETSGFKDGELFETEQGLARSKFVTARVPAGIFTCTLTNKDNPSESYNLLNTNTSGAICSTNADKTMAIIYLDAFLSSLSTGTYEYVIFIEDSFNDSDEVTLHVEVK